MRRSGVLRSSRGMVSTSPVSLSSGGKRRALFPGSNSRHATGTLFAASRTRARLALPPKSPLYVASRDRVRRRRSVARREVLRGLALLGQEGVLREVALPARGWPRHAPLAQALPRVPRTPTRWRARRSPRARSGDY